MIGSRALLACLPGLLALPLLAQPQIGGGTCSSASVNGNYSVSLTGRDVTNAVTFTNVEYSIGSVTFDGLSKVTFNLTMGSAKFPLLAQTLSGTYTMQSNCVGTVSITTGDTASFTLESYNSGKDYLMVGQDGVYSISLSGSVLPATCPTAIPAGSYSFNGNGFLLTSAQISGAFNISGLFQTSGTNSASFTAYYTSAAGSQALSATGTYTVGAGCTGSATMQDSTGRVYNVVFEFTSTTGENFTFISSSAGSLILATGRSL
jgi:hypothetical protein